MANAPQGQTETTAENESGPGALPLAGVRVLDVSRVFAGPVAGRVLSDLGADVVKVEPPEGDITRLWGHKAAGLSTYFVQQNAGKRNISIDLRQPGGPELVADLAAEADILVENFRPGVMAKYGLDWETLKVRNPGLIMLSISGFGQDGPDAGRAAYAAVVHAETGLVEHSRRDDPLDLTFSAADVLSGMHGVIGVMAALRVKDLTGVGQHIDVAMVDAMTFSSDRIVASLDGRMHDQQNGEVWETAAGPVVIPGGLKWVWHQMSEVHGLIDPTPKDAELAEKLASRRRIVTDYFRSLPDRDSVVAVLDEAGLAWGEVREMGAVIDAPTIKHRETVAQVDDRAGSTRPIIRSPYKMSVSDTREVGPPSFRGEHNHEVLADWLNADAATVDRFMEDGVMVCDEWADGSGFDEAAPS
jgi:crotonobetainyl-CoA:carnitine CoA-transferase CaiB-like acyl-CoA transferase